MLHNDTDALYAEILVMGGASWNATEDAPVFGYLVSVRETEYVVPVEEFGPEVIDAYMAVTSLPEGAYYGAWVEDDHVYLDVSLHVTTEAEALLIADIENQKAVYDAYEGRCIDTTKTLVS